MNLKSQDRNNDYKIEENSNKEGGGDKLVKPISNEICFIGKKNSFFDVFGLETNRTFLKQEKKKNLD